MIASKNLSAELLDSLMSDYKSPEDLIGEHGHVDQSGQMGFGFVDVDLLHDASKIRRRGLRLLAEQ